METGGGGLASFLEVSGVTQTELAAALGMELPTLNRKLRGHRPWKLDEANAALAFLRQRLQDDTLTLDQLFGEEGRVQLRLPMRYAKGAAAIPEAVPEPGAAKAS